MIGNTPGNSSQSKDINVIMTNRLYVENLPPSATEGSVRELFAQKGSVTEVKLVVDATTGVSRGRAFVTMATPELASQHCPSNGLNSSVSLAVRKHL